MGCNGYRYKWELTPVSSGYIDWFRVNQSAYDAVQTAGELSSEWKRIQIIATGNLKSLKRNSRPKPGRFNLKIWFLYD
jgi:hypothetical protein